MPSTKEKSFFFKKRHVQLNPKRKRKEKERKKNQTKKQKTRKGSSACVLRLGRRKKERK